MSTGCSCCVGVAKTWGPPALSPLVVTLSAGGGDGDGAFAPRNRLGGQGTGW